MNQPEVINQAINSPYAVVAIIAVVLSMTFGFLALGIREFIWIVKSREKNTPFDQIQTSFRGLSDVLTKLNENIIRQNERMSSMSEQDDKRHLSMIRHIDTIRDSLKGKR